MGLIPTSQGCREDEDERSMKVPRAVPAHWEAFNKWVFWLINQKITCNQ